MSLKRRLASMAIAAGVVVSLAPVGAAPAVAADCANAILLFSRSGVFLPANPSGRTSVGNFTYHSGSVGCTTEPELTVDSHYIYPGATMASGRLRTTVGSAQNGCILSTMMVNGGACTQWVLTESTVPGNFYADSPWHAMDPTKPSGTMIGNVNGFGSSNVYRTIDQ